MAERVLVVQLERKHLLALSRVFEDRGDVVLEASSLKETGNIVQRYKPDLILLDVQMLGANWARAIPQMQRGAPNSRILLTSNGNRSPLRRQSKEFKQWGVIRPPFSDSKIERALLSSSNGNSAAEGQIDAEPVRGKIRFPIRYKITFPYIALALALAMAAAIVVTNVVLDTVEERFTNQLIESGRLSAEWMGKEEDRLLESLRGQWPAGSTRDPGPKRSQPALLAPAAAGPV